MKFFSRTYRWYLWFQIKCNQFLFHSVFEQEIRKVQHCMLFIYLLYKCVRLFSETAFFYIINKPLVQTYDLVMLSEQKNLFILFSFKFWISNIWQLNSNRKAFNFEMKCFFVKFCFYSNVVNLKTSSLHWSIGLIEINAWQYLKFKFQRSMN